MLDRLIDKLLDRLEPRLEKLVRAAVDEAVNTAADRIEVGVTSIPLEVGKQLESLVGQLRSILPKKWPF